MKDTRFYGRRKGKPLRRHHTELVEHLLPGLRADPALIDAAKPLWLEIGFGGGEHLAHQAALHSDIAFIGAEAYVNGVAKLLAHIEERALANIRIHFGDARDFIGAMPESSVERVYLLYPDPWPKARHLRRRFVSGENLAAIHRLLKPAGQFIFASDIADYIDWVLRETAAHGGFGDTGCRAAPADWPGTRYEAKAIREGRTPGYLHFKKV